VNKIVLLIVAPFVCFAVTLLGLVILFSTVGGTAQAAACALSTIQPPAKAGSTTTTTTTTLALFVGDDEEPILIDRSALQIAIDQGWSTVNDSNVPVISFRPNSDGEIEVIDLDIDVGPTFE
jgi:hypothetical protein